MRAERMHTHTHTPDAGAGTHYSSDSDVPSVLFNDRFPISPHKNMLWWIIIMTEKLKSNNNEMKRQNSD